MSIQYNIHSREDGTSTVAVYFGGELFVADNTHTNFEAIRAGALEGDESIVDLFDVTTQIAERFANITERVSVANGRVYFDGDEIHNALTEQLLRFLDEGDEVEWIALANFYEKLAQNPCEHSREQLYEWLSKFDFTITLDGDILAYKGVNDDLTSCTRGQGIVNGEVVDHVANDVGNVVEMARSTVQHDPSVGCSKGLHVAAYPYASTFGSATLAVYVNPRDVVSVPTECSWEKVRVCRYTVADVIEKAYDSPLVISRDDEDDEDEDNPCGEDHCPCFDNGEECCDCGESPDEDETEDEDTLTITVTVPQSPLDTDENLPLVKELLSDEDLSVKQVVVDILASNGILTTKDSLRRFRQRHSL
jgi:galactitol-specific phosphotransferase system IIB component